MEIERGLLEFTATKQALDSLQRLLFCCQCEQLTKNVCMLGNCEHYFCKQCTEEQLGASCPVCKTPAHVRDAQVNKQLSNIVSVSLELGRLLQDPLGCSVPDKGEEQAGKKMSAKMASAQWEIPVQDSVSSPSNTRTCAQDVAMMNTQCSSPSDTRSKRQKRSPQKVAVRRSKGESLQTALTEICDEQLSDNSDEEVSTVKEVHTDNGTLVTMAAPRTRVRSKMNHRSPQMKKSVTRKNNAVKSTDVQASIHEMKTRKTDGSYEDDGIEAKQQPSPACTEKRRGRKTQGCGHDAAINQTPEEVSTSNEHFKLPTPSRASRRRSGNLQCNRNKVSSAPPTPPVDGDAATASKSCTPSSRRRSAPLTLIQEVLETGKAAAGRRCRSMPLGLSCEQSSRVSQLVGASPASKKSPARKSSEGMTGRVKRNAKGETPLHVAAIKGDISAVKELLNRGDNPNVRDNAGWTPLHEAVNHGHTAVAEKLLQHGAMVNTPGMENDTPLHDAVANHRLDCVHLLVSYGATVTARNVHGQTAQELAKTDDMKAALQQSAIQNPVVTRLPEPEDAEEFRPLCFLGTALSRDQRGLLQKCATKLHAKVVEDYCTEVTHLVSSVNADGQCPRTLKYLHGVLGGKWIVSIDWVTICLEYGQKVSEEPFEIPGSSTHPNSSAANKARINCKLQLPGLFDGCQVYLHGSFTRLPPSRSELAHLLQLGGAHLLTREPRLANLDEYDVTVPYHAVPGSSIVDCGIFVVHDGGSKVPNIQAQRMRSVPASWITECIATFSLPEPPSA